MKLSPKILSTICLIIIALLFIGKVELFNYYPDYSYGLDAYTVTENRRDSLNAEIRSVQTKLDSVNREKQNYIQGFDGYSGWSGGFIGLVKPSQSRPLYKSPNLQVYVKLSKIGLKIQETEGPKYLVYYTNNGVGYLSKTKLTKIGKEYSISYVDHKVDYNYSVDDNSILIPVNSLVWKISIQILIYLTMFLFIIGYLFAIKLVFQFLLDISRNKGFNELNVNRLRKIAFLLLILGSHTYIVNLIIYIIFSFNYSTDGVTITYSFWQYDYFIIILSAFCYLIYTAFKRGMALQQEQDLTI